jgi:hypothetical protein
MGKVLFPGGRCDAQDGSAHLLVDHGGQIPRRARPCARPERLTPELNRHDFDAGVPEHLLLPKLIKTQHSNEGTWRLRVQISKENGETNNCYRY